MVEKRRREKGRKRRGKGRKKRKRDREEKFREKERGRKKIIETSRMSSSPSHCVMHVSIADLDATAVPASAAVSSVILSDSSISSAAASILKYTQNYSIFLNTG